MKKTEIKLVNGDNAVLAENEKIKVRPLASGAAGRRGADLRGVALLLPRSGGQNIDAACCIEKGQGQKDPADDGGDFLPLDIHRNVFESQERVVPCLEVFHGNYDIARLFVRCGDGVLDFYLSHDCFLL